MPSGKIIHVNIHWPPAMVRGEEKRGEGKEEGEGRGRLQRDNIIIVRQ